MNVQTINPSTADNLNQYEVLNWKETKLMLDNAAQAFSQWRNTPILSRSQLMIHMAELLSQKKNELAILRANEMGKPLNQGKAEIEKCARLCEYYAEHGQSFLDPRQVEIAAQKSLVCYQPLGVILAIMPWNFPFWQVFRCVVPALMAGNAAILKHAPIVTGCGYAIEALFIEAGFPSHLFQHAVADNDLTAKIIADDNIAALSFTGSEKAGRIVAANAASHLKKSVLELGGSDPYLVLADADLDLAAECIVASRLNNCGQVCIAAKRVIAVDTIYDALTVKIQELLKSVKIGSPLDENTTMGPMAREDLRQILHQQVLDTVKQGGRLIVGGQIPPGKGFFYPPTLMVDVRPGMPAFEEELFGPVIVLIPAKNEADAITLANQSPYGLSGAIFSRDKVKAEEIATNELNVGCCFVNAFVATDPRLPFGGIKCSGYGRELSREGLLEFVNVKTVVIR